MRPLPNPAPIAGLCEGAPIEESRQIFYETADADVKRFSRGSLPGQSYIAPGKELRAVWFDGDRAFVATMDTSYPWLVVDLSQGTAPVEADWC